MNQDQASSQPGKPAHGPKPPSGGKACERASEALDRSVAVWTQRVADGGWNSTPLDGAHQKLIDRGLTGLIGKISGPGRVEFLTSVLDRTERLLDLIADQPAGVRSSLTAAGILMDTQQWLGALDWNRWPEGDLFPLFARSCFLKMRAQTHPVWPTVRAMMEDLHRDHETVFCGITRCGRGGDTLPDLAGSGGALLQEAFRASLRHACAARFEGLSPWRRAMFVGDLAGHAWSDGEADVPMGVRRLEFLADADTLAAVACIFYPAAGRAGDGGNKILLGDFLADNIQADVVRRLVALTDDEGVLAVVDAYPDLAEDPCVLVRMQRIALQAEAGGGRKKSPVRI